MDKYGGFKDESGGNLDKYGSIGGTETKSKSGKLPSLPPKIDRLKKPSKKSAAERLFGARAQHSPQEEKAVTTSPTTAVTAAAAGSPASRDGYGSVNNSNSNSYNPHAPENYDSYNKRSSTGSGQIEPGYAKFSRNPAGGFGGGQPPSVNGGSPPYPNGEAGGMNSLPNGGLGPHVNGGIPNQNGYATKQPSPATNPTHR